MRNGCSIPSRRYWTSVTRGNAADRRWSSALKGNMGSHVLADACRDGGGLCGKYEYSWGTPQTTYKKSR